MINVGIHYPAKPGSRFDAGYYLETHIPLALRLLGEAVKGVSVEIGLSGAMPGSPAPFAATVNMVFDSPEAFYAAFLPHAAEIQGDIPNYTDIEPVIQFGDIRFTR